MTTMKTTTSGRSSPCRCRPSVPAAADVIGQVYNGRKKAHGGDRASPQNEDSGKTCQAVAAELGVGRTTVRRDAARPAPAGCRHRVRLVDDERPIARREPARRSSVQMRSRAAGSRRTPAERALLASQRHAGRTTLTHRATRAARPAGGRLWAVKPSTGVLGSSERYDRSKRA